MTFCLIHNDRGPVRIIDSSNYPDEAAFRTRIEETLADLRAADPAAVFHASDQGSVPLKMRELYGEQIT